MSEGTSGLDPLHDEMDLGGRCLRVGIDPTRMSVVTLDMVNVQNGMLTTLFRLRGLLTGAFAPLSECREKG